MLPALLRVRDPSPPAGTISLYQAETSGPAGGSNLGAVLYLFGGVVPIAAIAMFGLARGGRRTGLPLVLSGAIAAWSLTWIGILIRLGTFGTSLDIGFWLQAVSIGVALIGTILLATRRTGAHERGAAGLDAPSRLGHRLVQPRRSSPTPPAMQS